MHAIMPGIRLVSWDVDGTLFSYSGIAAPLARQVWQTRGKEGWPEVARRIAASWRFHRAVECQRRSPGSAVDATDLTPFTEAVWWERAVLLEALGMVRPRASAVALMNLFAAAGIAQVALSDFECESKVRRLGLMSSIAATYACEHIGYWKPSPIPLARIQQDFGVAPSEHLHIGDRQDTDGAAAAANGCRFMLIDQLPRAWSFFNAICAPPRRAIRRLP